jgi:hypothetical protein
MAEILPEAIDLMHALMQDRHDADIAVAEPPPIDEVPFVLEEVAFDAELRWYRPRCHAMALDFPEGFEQSRNVTVRLFTPPLVAGVAVDIVETVRSRLLDADGGHSGSGQFRLRAMTSSAVSGWYEDSGAA